jgi:hypothetical protein
MFFRRAADLEVLEESIRNRLRALCAERKGQTIYAMTDAAKAYEERDEARILCAEREAEIVELKADREQSWTDYTDVMRERDEARAEVQRLKDNALQELVPKAMAAHEKELHELHEQIKRLEGEFAAAKQQRFTGLPDGFSLVRVGNFDNTLWQEDGRLVYGFRLVVEREYHPMGRCVVHEAREKP